MSTNKNLLKGPPGRKLCARCDHWLPKDTFGRDAREPDGLTGRCRPCRSTKPPPVRQFAGGDHVARLRVGEAQELDRRANALKGWRPDAACLATRARVAAHMWKIGRLDRARQAWRTAKVALVHALRDREAAKVDRERALDDERRLVRAMMMMAWRDGPLA